MHTAKERQIKQHMKELEYSKKNKLHKVANFSGSAGFILILKKTNHLFVDGRYTIQAKQQSGNRFKIHEIPYIWPKDILKNNDPLNIGFDPKLHTEKQLKTESTLNQRYNNKTF